MKHTLAKPSRQIKRLNEKMLCEYYDRMCFFGKEYDNVQHAIWRRWLHWDDTFPILCYKNMGEFLHDIGGHEPDNVIVSFGAFKSEEIGAVIPHMQLVSRRGRFIYKGRDR